MADRGALTATGTAQTPISGKVKEDVKRSLLTAGAYLAITEEKKAVTCTIVADAEDTNVTDIHIQFKDRNGDNIAYAWTGLVCCTTTVNYTVNAGSTGLAQHGSPVGGVIGAAFAKGAFICTSNATGALDLIYTDTASNAECEVGVVFDGGYTVWTADLKHGA